MPLATTSWTPLTPDVIYDRAIDVPTTANMWFPQVASFIQVNSNDHDLDIPTAALTWVALQQAVEYQRSVDVPTAAMSWQALEPRVQITGLPGPFVPAGPKYTWKVAARPTTWIIPGRSE